MKRLTRFRFISKTALFAVLAVFTFSLLIHAQENPRTILAKVEANYSDIEDYAATVLLTVDIPNFRMPKKKIAIFYKKPDKFSIKTSGFALVPKVGVFPVPSNFIKDDTKLRYNRSESGNGILYHIIDVIPKETEKFKSDISLWVNSRRWTIDRAVVDMKDKGRTEVNFSYREIESHWLPDSTVLMLNYKKGIPKINRPSLEAPFGGSPEMEKIAEKKVAAANSMARGFGGSPEAMKIAEGEVGGKVKLVFTDFVINAGLDDSFFQTEKK